MRPLPPSSEVLGLRRPFCSASRWGNVCLIKTRRHPKRAQALTAAFKLRHRLGVEEMVIDHDQVISLAAQTGLTGYDASYLWLARQLGAELVTLDRQLERAAAAS